MCTLSTYCAGCMCDFNTYSVHSVHPIGGPHKAVGNTQLPFKDIQVWFKLRLQTRDIHTCAVLPVQTVLASPPEGAWEYGCYDSVVVNMDGTKTWPSSGLQGLFLSYLSYPHH